MDDIKELQEKMERLKAEKWSNATLEQKINILHDEIKNIQTSIDRLFSLESQKIHQMYSRSISETCCNPTSEFYVISPYRAYEIFT